jgi:hypothetical protein
LRLEGDDQRLCPIEARRETLMRLVEGVDGILFTEALAAEGALLFAKDLRTGPRRNRVEADGNPLQENHACAVAPAGWVLITSLSAACVCFDMCVLNFRAG